MAIGGVDKLALKKIAMKLLRKDKDLPVVRSRKMQLKRIGQVDPRLQSMFAT